MIREMRASDVPAVAELAQQKRLQYETYEPQFWRVAASATEIHTEFLAGMQEDPDVLSLVAVEEDVVLGYVVARLVPAPPVYDPGGPAAYVDDFSVRAPGLWGTVGLGLLRHAQRELASMGAVQVVVVCGHRDDAKRQMLQEAELSLATEWYVSELGRTER
jgi:hypothetical protein